MVGDDVGWYFQGPLHISIYGRYGCAKCKNSNKIGKNQKKIREKYRWCISSGSISGSSVYIPQIKSHLIWSKSEETHDTDDFTGQGPLSGGGHMTNYLKW